MVTKTNLEALTQADIDWITALKAPQVIIRRSHKAASYRFRFLKNATWPKSPTQPIPLNA